MERVDIAGMGNALREAFRAAGKDIEEKRTAMGSAFFARGHAIGQFETRANVLRARLWLADKERSKLEARPTYDPDSGWLHVVSDEDVAFVRTLVPSALRSAASGSGNPSSPRQPLDAATPWTVEPTERRTRATTAASSDKAPEKKKSAAPRRPSTRI